MVTNTKENIQKHFKRRDKNISRSLSRDAITEEKCSKSLPESERMGVRRLPLGQQSLPREPFIRQLTMASTLLTSSSSDDSSDENT